MKLILNEFKKISRIRYFIVYSCLFIIVLFIFKYSTNRDSKYIVETVYTIIPIIGVVICVFFGGIVSNEFQNGTIRAYLTKPIKRNRILFSKLILIVINILIIMIYLMILYFLFGKYYYNYLFNIEYFINIFVNFIPIFFIGFLTLFFSLLFNNSAVCVGVTLFLYLSSGLIVSMLFEFGLNFFEYSFLPYMDFSIFLDSIYIDSINNEFNIDLNLKTAVFILIINMIFLYLCSYQIFTKKDIKN